MKITNLKLREKRSTEEISFLLYIFYVCFFLSLEVNISFKTFEELQKAFSDKLLYPLDLKKAVIASLDSLLSPIRSRFLQDPQLAQLTARAYPSADNKSTSTTNKNVNNNNNKNTNNNNNNNNKKEEKEQSNLSRLDLRVGVIKSVAQHPNAEALYVEEIDVGDTEKGENGETINKTRTIVSGLTKFIPIEKMQGRRVVVVCNLKPAALRGVVSFLHFIIAFTFIYYY